MVRHECAEALGSIATDECTNVLKNYVSDEEVGYFFFFEQIFSELFENRVKLHSIWPNMKTVTSFSMPKLRHEFIYIFQFLLIFVVEMNIFLFYFFDSHCFCH